MTMSILYVRYSPTARTYTKEEKKRTNSKTNHPHHNETRRQRPSIYYNNNTVRPAHNYNSSTINLYVIINFRSKSNIYKIVLYQYDVCSPFCETHALLYYALSMCISYVRIRFANIT